MLLDVIEHLTQPQQLLAALSSWSLKHGEPPLVVSVPNAAHFDLGLRLLCGRWTPTETGMLDSTHLRFFTEETLGACSVGAVGRWPTGTTTRPSTPTSTTASSTTGSRSRWSARCGALSEAFNPNPLVQQFVWALKPVPVTTPPTSFLHAVGPDEDGEPFRGPEHPAGP